MTVQEAKNQIEYNVKYRIFTPRVEALQIALECIEEVEQYRALGTVEELKEAREKQVAKKPIIQQRKIRDCINMVKIFDVKICPNCGITLDDREQFKDYPCKCGQMSAQTQSL